MTWEQATDVKIHEWTKDGRAEAEIADKRRGEVLLRYPDGDKAWVMENKLQRNTENGALRVV